MFNIYLAHSKYLINILFLLLLLLLNWQSRVEPPSLPIFKVYMRVFAGEIWTSSSCLASHLSGVACGL